MTALAMTSDTGSAYDELYVYTMGRDSFILQHVVDAQKAQTARESRKPIGGIVCEEVLW